MRTQIKLSVLACGALLAPLTQQGGQEPAARQGAETRQAQAHIVAAFPRTRRLLNYLSQEDPDAYTAVIEHSSRLARLREEAALQFAQQQHPELERLLQQLRQARPSAYDAAIRQLLGNVANLGTIRQGSEEEYEAALEEWKVQSQVRLVAAQIGQLSRSREDQRDQIAALERDLTDLLIAGERANRRRIEMQIARLEGQIQRLRGRLNRDPLQYVDRQRRNVLNRQRRGR